MSEFKNTSLKIGNLNGIIGSYLRRGVPLAVVAVVNGQEPRLTSIVEGGRPWNGLTLNSYSSSCLLPLAAATLWDQRASEAQICSQVSTEK